MMSLKKKVAVALTAASVAAGSFAVPAMAAETRGFDAARLDKAQAEYTQYRYRHGYRGHWRGSSRGAAVAGAIGLGILGAAAIAANRNAYAGPSYYDDDGYYAPLAPVYVAPRRYYAPYGYQPYDFRDYR
ncbi:hypothetical protein FHT98_4439 [Bosea sp. AK1]|uniref:hypothetical protein n=1 Tax=Bosea sp. AK1 TaxID=2587160 RepID=UPI0011513CCF|nr:hypothetical protein [Bosea sp. AK1]TQI76641.1 hypothetical protein FHT98_4439 [Bosea sp. AK1]